MIDNLEGGIASKMISGWSYKKSSLAVQKVEEGESKNNVKFRKGGLVQNKQAFF